MPYYLFQASYTSDALKAMIAKPQDREAASRALVESVGATMHCFYFSFGKDDAMAIIEAEDDTTAAALSIAIGASGSFSGGGTTKLMTTAEAQTAMQKAGAAVASYSAPTG